MSPLTTLDLSEREDLDSDLQESVDLRLKERNKILKVAMTLVALVAGIAPFVNYLILEMPIFGLHEASLVDSFSAAARVGAAAKAEAPDTLGAVDETRVVDADVLNVRKGPGPEYPAMGQVTKGTRISVVGEERGWLKIPTSQGDGWIDAYYVSPPPGGMNLWDHLLALDKEGINPKLAAGIRRLPPYSPWIPAVALMLAAASLVFLPFGHTEIGLAALRTVLFTWALLSLYALVFHLLLVQGFRNTLGELSRATAADLSEAGPLGELAGVATQAFANNTRIHVGPALYVLAASGVLMSSLSLFLVVVQRRQLVRPYREPGEPMRYLDL
jgi:hypothetical protein